MDTIVTKISSLLSPVSRLVVYTALTQHLVGSNDVVLWDEGPLRVAPGVYEKLKVLLKRRGSRFYTHNNILPYSDFCIALLCAKGYSINHILTPSILARTYTAAWRAIETVSQIGDGEVKNWLAQYISGRTAIGYSATHGVHLENLILPIREITNSNKSERLENDSIILSVALSLDSIVQIPYYEDNPKDSVVGIFHSNYTPESHLCDLILCHNIMNI